MTTLSLRNLFVLSFAFFGLFFAFPIQASNPGYCDEGGAGGPYECEMPPIVVITIYASPNPTYYPQGTTITWDSNGGSSGYGGGCTSNEFNTGGQFRGSVYVNPTVTTTYNISCNIVGALGTSYGYNAVTVTVNPAPMPNVYAGDTVAKTGTVGQGILLESSVGNGGNATASNFPNIFHINGIGYVAAQTHTLGSGQFAGLSAWYTFPSIGYYSVRACADTNTGGGGAISESNEGDNCGPWQTITVNPSGACYATPDGASVAYGSGTHTVYAYNVPPSYSQVWFPTWSDVNGQDDIVWYYATAHGNGTFSATINFGNHSGYGTYQVHPYMGNGGSAQTFCDTANFTRVGSPDLTAGGTSLSYPNGHPYAVAGVPFTANSSVSNIGTWIATNFPNMFHVGSWALYGAQTHTLGEGGSAAISGSVNISTPGVYNIQSCADYNTGWGTAISESNEGNNCGAWTNFSVTPQAPTGFTASCNANGTSMNFSWNAAAGSAYYYVRVSSPNGTCPAGWQYVWGSTCIPNPDQWNSTSVTNYAITPGTTYYYGAHGSLSNGAWGPYGGSSISCSGTMDLTASNLSPNLSVTLLPNTPVTFTGRVNNAGSLTASNVQNMINICDAGCATLSTAVPATTVSSIAPNTSSGNITGTYTFTSPGTYYYRTCSDMAYNSWTGTNAETNEGNNCDGWTQITVSAPNLVAGSVYAGGAITANVATTLYSNTTNSGTVATGGNSVTAFQLATSAAGAGATTIGYYTVGNIAAGGQQQASTGYTFTSTGPWYARSCVDWNGQITETDEGNCGAWEAITVSDPAISASCSASPTSVSTNSNVTWTASASGGNGTYTYSWSGTAPLSGTGVSRVVSYSSSGTKTGQVQVTSGSQSTTVSCSNSVSVSTPPTATLSSSPTTVTTGNASTLTWSSSGATSCTGTGFNTGGATSGSVSTGALTSTQNYQVSCTGAGGTTNDFETVSVIAPTANLTAEPARARANRTTDLKWSATDVTSCTITANQPEPTFTATYSPVTAGVNTTAVANIVKQTDFTLTCQTTAGTNVSSSVQVNIPFNSDEF